MRKKRGQSNKLSRTESIGPSPKTSHVNNKGGAHALQEQIVAESHRGQCSILGSGECGRLARNCLHVVSEVTGYANHPLQSYSNTTFSNSTFKTLPFDSRVSLPSKDHVMNYLWFRKRHVKSLKQCKVASRVSQSVQIYVWNSRYARSWFFLGISDRVMGPCSMKLTFWLWVKKDIQQLRQQQM